jgi:hypothetical protein
MTTDLALLSVDRAGLPDFPGATVRDQLLNARDQALAVLQKYVPNLAYDPDAANTVLAQVEAWEERNQATLQAALQDPTMTQLPEQVRLVFGNAEAQQFILAVFSRAAEGLGPWDSGRIAVEVTNGQMPGVNDTWARTDAAYRLRVFGGIVQMDKTGCMQHFFVDPNIACATSGFGIAPVLIWAIVVVVVALAAILMMYVYSARRLDENNALMRDMCARAQADGDQATVAACIQATKELQAENPLSDAVTAVAKVGAILGVAYILVRYGIPAISSAVTSQRRRV